MSLFALWVCSVPLTKELCLHGMNQSVGVRLTLSTYAYVLYVCLCVCGYMDVCVCVHMSIQVCVCMPEARCRLRCDAFRDVILFLRQGLSLWTCQSGGSGGQGAWWDPLVPRAEITNACHHSLLFTWILVIKFSFSRLHGKYSTSGAISEPPPTPVFWYICQVS